MDNLVRILETFPVTHDVKCIRVEKPDNFTFIPGQATEISINIPGMKDERRPFTFTCLNSDPYLEFMIKGYPEHHGVTAAIHTLSYGDELLLHDVFGEINYKGQGVFIAGGAGITPFVAIMRELDSMKKLRGNILLFGNKTRDDIILQDEFELMLGTDFINVLSQERTDNYLYGHIDRDLLKSYTGNSESIFYVCGPPPMMDSVVPALKELGVKESHITIEGM
jgi:ferredoxin-NADP reductase